MSDLNIAVLNPGGGFATQLKKNESKNHEKWSDVQHLLTGDLNKTRDLMNLEFFISCWNILFRCENSVNIDVTDFIF